MKNKNLIIKIALGISVVAVLFSIVTLIRAIVLHSRVAFPIIQVVGSILIAAVCCYLFTVMRRMNSEEESQEDQLVEQTGSEQEPEKPDDEKTEYKTEEKIETDTNNEEMAETEAPESKDDDYYFSNFME